MRGMNISTRKVGRGNPVFIVAEMSGNHNHDIKRALQIIDAAADAGADAVIDKKCIGLDPRGRA